MKSKFLAAMILSIFAFSIASSAIVPANAQPQVFVQNPLTMDGNFIFTTDTTAVGFKFNATLWVSGFATQPVFSWQVRLNYNSTILNATRAFIAPPTDADYIFFGLASIRPQPARAPGSVLLGDSSLTTAVTSATPKKLGIVEFQIMLAPLTGNTFSSNLDINNADTYLLDFDLIEIAITKISGTYQFSSPAVVNTISIAVDKPQVIVGSTVTVSGSITPVTAGADVTIFYKLNNETSWSILATVTTDPAGDYTYPWVTSSVGLFDLKSGWADVNSTVVSVNVIVMPLKTFDVTGDGKVDILDIAHVARAFGAYNYPPDFVDPRYDAAFDFDNNNVIDIIDLVLIVQHFGMTV